MTSRFTFGMKSKVFCGFIILSSCLVILSSGCPVNCLCPTESKTVNCDCKNNFILTDVPSGIPNNTEILELNACNIKNISQDSFKNLPSLKIIRMENQKSGLNLKDGTIFQGLENLISVYLGKNGLTSLPAGLFANLSKLTTVVLDGNPMETLPDDLFQNSPNLEVLSVANMQLKHKVIVDIVQGKFGTNIERLFLFGTPLTNLPLLGGLPKLNNLNVGNCQIEYIQADILKGTMITIIDLSGNPIKSINENAFRGQTPAIINFRCERCNLTSDTAFGFIKNMPSLGALHLKDNNIKNISKDAFTGLTDLHLIDLSSNAIETIDENLFSGLQKCISDQSCIKLGDNPLKCDCNLAWFYEFTKKWSTVQNGLICKTPREVANISFADLEVSKFCCGSKCGASPNPNAAWVVSAHMMVAVLSQFLLLGIPLILG